LIVSAILSEAPRQESSSARTGIVVRPLQENDLASAESIFRLAFGTFLRAPQPETFWADRDYVQSRWHADPKSAFAAEVDGHLVGSNFAVSWGSVGFFGPLTVHPNFWNKGIGVQLVEPVVNRLQQLNVRHMGLFTFADSAKHVGLYQRFGFWPRFLSAVMSAPVGPSENAPQSSRFSQIPENEQSLFLADCRTLTNDIYAGLDLSIEVRQLHTQKRGDTVFLCNGIHLRGFAICHYGPSSQAGADACLIKFAVVRPGRDAERSFDRLLAACHRLAAEAGMSRLLAGVNMECGDAYRHLLARNFRTEMLGVNMHRPSETGYYCPEIFLLDDWR
jgi:ribosomal protein S18 acetylase RimI-like enzyme